MVDHEGFDVFRANRDLIHRFRYRLPVQIVNLQDSVSLCVSLQANDVEYPAVDIVAFSLEKEPGLVSQQFANVLLGLLGEFVDKTPGWTINRVVWRTTVRDPNSCLDRSISQLLMGRSFSADQAILLSHSCLPVPHPSVSRPCAWTLQHILARAPGAPDR